jgi:hypothetical protein
MGCTLEYHQLPYGSSTHPFTQVAKVEDISFTSGKLDFSRFYQGDVWVAIIFFLCAPTTRPSPLRVCRYSFGVAP